MRRRQVFKLDGKTSGFIPRDWERALPRRSVRGCRRSGPELLLSPRGLVGRGAGAALGTPWAAQANRCLHVLRRHACGRARSGTETFLPSPTLSLCCLVATWPVGKLRGRSVGRSGPCLRDWAGSFPFSCCRA